MSKRNSHTDFIPVVGNLYESPSCEGIILEVAPRYTTADNKEIIRFSIGVTEVFDDAATFEVGSVIWRQATPTHKANGQWNVMRNAK